MKATFADNILPQLDELLATYEKLARRTPHRDFRDIEHSATSGFLTAVMSAIHRIAGPHSQYAIQSQAMIEKFTYFQGASAIPHLAGVLKALRHDVASGYLDSVQELIHASLFADFLEMAEHLLNEGYKDPAVVLIGGVLEEHLRKLCDKNGIPTATTDSKGVVRPKKAETMNMDLAGGSVYSKLDQKNVTAWLDLRNKAAHGRYAEYTSQQVELLLQSVRDFLTRNPA